jgi:hypothetical protein
MNLKSTDKQNTEKKESRVQIDGEADSAAIPLGSVSGFAVNDEEADELEPLTGSHFSGGCDGPYGRAHTGD